MGKREGFGAVLADGSKKAAERIGKGSEEYAMHVGGREMPFHDPRMSPGQGMFYIADATPSQHCGPQQMAMLEQGTPRAGSAAAVRLQRDLRRVGTKGDPYARGAAYWHLLSSAGLCSLYAQFDCPPIVELLRPVTGWDIDWAEGLEIGKRILTLRQAFNAREGLKPDDFRFPKRFEQHLMAGSRRRGADPTVRAAAQGVLQDHGLGSEDRRAAARDHGSLTRACD